MADRPAEHAAPSAASLATSSDDILEAALLGLGAEILVPVGTGLPGLVRAQVETMERPTRAGWRWGRHGGSSPLRRGAILAAVLVVIVAAAAGAATLGLPGLRIVFGPADTPGVSAAPSGAQTPPPGSASPGPLGGGLGLGSEVSLDGIDGAVGFRVALPGDPRLAIPDAVWWQPTLGHGQVALVWASGPGLPPVDTSGIGAILTETPGRTDEGFIQKTLGPGSTVEAATVDGAPGFWISGDPHEFLYLTPDGVAVQDSRRVVGDTLTWWADGILYRFESDLGRDAAIELAESME